MMMNSTSRGGMTPTPRGGQGDGGVARGRDTKPYNSFSSDSRNNNNLMQQSYRSQNTASRYNNSYLDESNADSLAARNRYGSTPQERRQRFLEEQNNRRRNREQQDNQGGGRRNRSLSPVGRGNPTTAGTATGNLKDDAMYASTHSSASSRNSRSLSPIRTKSTLSSDLPDVSPPTITRPPATTDNYVGGPSHHLRINRTRSYSPSAEPYHHFYPNPNNHRGSITESASVSSPNNSPRRTNGFPFRQQQQQQQQQRQSITESPSVSPPNNNNPHHPPPAIATTRNHNGRLLGGVSPPFSPTKPGSYLYVPQNLRNNNSNINQRHNHSNNLRDSNTSIHSSIRGSATSVVSDITDMVSVTHDGIPVWSDHVDDEASAGVPPTKHQIQNRITIEIQPGLSLPLRGAEETTKAMGINFIVTPNCMVCTCQIQCIADAEYVLCPVCKSVSPIEGNTGNGGGVGLGLEMQ